MKSLAMREAHIIDGKALATRVADETACAARRYTDAVGDPPCLAVILVGGDPASSVYVRNKHLAAERIGFKSLQETLPEDTSETELAALVQRLNDDPGVNGLLVQLPLPRHIDSLRLLDLIRPEKDVDGFHPMNVGRLASAQKDKALIPCTPAGCIKLIESVHGDDFSGLHALIVGRSNIVGKPTAHLLLAKNCTVTIAHSRTTDLPALTQTADILVVAVGCPNLITGDMIKPGATVIDVGINPVPSTKKPGKTILVGDVHFKGARNRAGAITPVPGGVGPMTVAMLMRNTLTAASRQNGFSLLI